MWEAQVFSLNVISKLSTFAFGGKLIVPFVSVFGAPWLILVLLLIPSATSLGGNNRRERIEAEHGAVAADDGRCSSIGRDVLRDGGHAVDSAVAVALCLGVVSPASSGIGGGAFMIVRLANGTAKAFDMRETAPLMASQNMYKGKESSKATGPLSIAVPGELLGLHEAWKKYGRLSWSRLVIPAAHLARNGFTISPYLYTQMNSTKSAIMADKGLRHVFTFNGSLLQPGDICYNKKMARTLETIAKHGVKPFYNGIIGYNLVKDVRKAGGILSMDDLRQYRVKVTKPISADTWGFKILGMPPPSSGGPAIVLILNILAQYGSSLNVSGPLMTHRVIESLKHAFAVRMNLGDPDFINTKAVVKDMLSPKFAEQLQKTINDDMTFSPSHYGGKWNQLHDHGTSHLSIVDHERNAVSMTSTINSYFGAAMLSARTGIVLNNEMDDFSMPAKTSINSPLPAPPNFIRPGKRPLSSMSPTIVVKDGKVKAVVGASGGALIIAGTTEVLLSYFAKGMDPLAAVMAPRVYNQLIPDVVEYEDWQTVSGDHFEVDEKTIDFLKKRGHVLKRVGGGTICQFIAQDLESPKPGKLVAVSDPRKGGFPAGY